MCNNDQGKGLYNMSMVYIFYHTMDECKQLMVNPVEFCLLLDVTAPWLKGQLTGLYHRLMAPPALPQVSGLVIQASV